MKKVKRKKREMEHFLTLCRKIDYRVKSEKDIPKENLTLSTKILHRVKRKNFLGRAVFDSVERTHKISQRSL